MKKIYISFLLIFSCFYGQSQDNFAFKLIPVNPEVPDVCYIEESKYFAGLTLENWQLYAIDDDYEQLLDAGEASATISSFLDKKMVVNLRVNEFIDTGKHPAYFIFLPIDIPADIPKGKMYELGTFAVYFHDLHELPISDFYQCTQEGIEDGKIYQMFIDDTRNTLMIFDDSLQNRFIPYGKFAGQTLSEIAYNLQPNDIRDLMVLVEENLLLYMGKNIHAGKLVIEWMIAGSPVSNELLVNEIIRSKNSDSLIIANRQLLDDNFWTEYLYQTLRYLDYNETAYKDSSRMALEKGIRIAKLSDNKDVLHDLSMTEVQVLFAEDDLRAAMKVLKKEYSFSKKNKLDLRMNLVKRDMAYIYKKQNKFSKAEKEYKAALAYYTDQHTLDEYAELLALMNRTEEAIARLLEAVEQEGGNAGKAYYFQKISDHYRGLGNVSQAEYYKSLVEYYEGMITP